MAERAAKSLIVLRQQANELWPTRSKASDGLKGDAAHAATASDHNPNPQGVICAFDLTHDPANGVNCDAISESIRLHPHPDVKYVIYNRRIFRAYDKPGIPAFTWSPYTKDPHDKHMHVSVGVGPDGHSRQPYDDMDEWNIISSQSTPATPITPTNGGNDDMLLIARPSVIILLTSGKLTTIHTPENFYKVAASGVPVVDATDDKQWKTYTDAYGQPT